MRWRRINFQCRGVLLIWIIVRQWPTALAVCAGGDCLDIFSLVYHLSSFSLSFSRCGGSCFGHFFLSFIISLLFPSLWETAPYRLKYCLKGPLSPKQPTSLGFDTRSDNILSFLLPLFQEGQLSVTGESMCTKYWLTA